MLMSAISIMDRDGPVFSQHGPISHGHVTRQREPENVEFPFQALEDLLTPNLEF
jgi:hypothetical protein